MTGPAPPRRPATDGLQPERTALAWSRTSLGALANAALPLFRDTEHHSGPLRLLPTLMALVIVVVAYAIGQRRLTALRSRPIPPSRSIRRQIHAIGWATISLAVAMVLVLGVQPSS